MPEGRPTIARADGRRLSPLAGWSSSTWAVTSSTRTQTHSFRSLNNGVNLRRGRLYFIGKFDDSG